MCEELVVGAVVKCKYRGGSSYQAVLASVDEGGFWTVVWDDNDTNDTTGHPKTDITEIISIPEPEPVTISHSCFCFYNSIWLHGE